MGTPPKALPKDRAQVFRSLAFVTTLLLAASLVAAPVLARAVDLDRIVAFSIASQPLDSALLEFSKQAQIQVIVAPDIDGTAEAPAVNGPVSARTALDRLLRHTGLKYAAVDTSISVTRAGDASAPSPRATTGTAPASVESSDKPPLVTDQTSSRTSSPAQASQTFTPTHRAGYDREKGDVLQEVIVTAQKREERLQDVPMSLTALTGDELASSQSYRFEDYVGKVPGLTLIDTYGATGSQLVIRGITTGAASINSSVASYIDETPYGVEGVYAASYLAAPNLDTFDMQRIEVLRGPQGTLYGANALAGLLKYVTNSPDPSAFAATVETGVSSVQHGGTGFDAHGLANLPLSGDLALRLVGYDNYYPGFIDDPSRGLTDINGTRYTGGRVSLLYKPTSSLSIRFNALYQDRSYGDWGNEDVNPGTLTPIFGSLIQENLIGQPGHTTNQIYNVTMSWDAGFIKLLSTSSYESFEPRFLWDFSGLFGIPPALFGRPLGVAVPEARPAHAWIQELRLSSHVSGPLQWQLGGFFTSEGSDLQADLFPIDATTKTILYNFSPNLGIGDTRTHYREYAAFGNVDYHISPTVEASLGGRYSKNNQTFHEVSSGLFDGNVDLTNESSEGVFTYSGDMSWHVTPESMLYARIASGFVPGGPNAVFRGSAGVVPLSYDSSTTVNYEAGIKSGLFENHVTVDISAFDIEWKKIQLLATIGGLSGVVNGGGARSDGVEWNFAYAPIRGLTLNLNGAYTDAHLTQATPSSVGGMTGDHLPAVPEWAGSASAEYRRPISDRWSGFAGVDWRFTGSRYAEFEPTTPRQKMPSFNIVDMRVGAETGRWSLAFYVKNVANELAINYVQDKGVDGGLTEQSAAVYQPRTVGVTLTASF
jgi:iron complex outermembrane receptor protein